MKFLTYMLEGGAQTRFGFKKDEYVIDTIRASIWANEIKGDPSFLEIPSSLKRALQNWDANSTKLKELDASLPDMNIQSHSGGGKPIAILEKDIQLFPPIPNPQSFRDFYAFEQHVKNTRKLRGLDMPPDWYKIAVFHFSNPATLYGHGEEIPYPKGTEELDYELEFSIIIATGGSDISQENANRYIAGYTICNDWSARDLQRKEMVMNLGQAKGADFASSFGPYMVTPDELVDALDDNGKLNLRMTCHVNGKLLSEGNTNDLYHPFAKMIQYASMNANLLPGDYLGSGTVGSGCILELGLENSGGWIQKGDVVRMEIERLGVLENKIV